MKKVLKRILPGSMQRKIKSYIDNKIIKNYYKTNFEKNALISYIINPFKKDTLSHTNYFEARSIAKILFESGYNVDIINYNSVKKLTLDKYDLIAGFGDVFQRYFESSGHNLKTIYYGAGMHVCHQNHATLNRVKDVYFKKGVWLGKSARFVEKTWSHQTTLVDGIIALGNQECLNSYKKYYDGKIFSVPATYYATQNAGEIIDNREKDAAKNYLWFGSSGLIHKGLDLLLDYFSLNKDLTLHICGYVEKEKEFCEIYKNELYNTGNIKLHGFVNVNSREFYDILKSCYFVIYPSCSEGGAPSVVTTVGNGGLIPIISRESSFSTGNEIFIESLNAEGISEAIDRSVLLGDENLKVLSVKNYEYVIKNHSNDVFYDKLKESIKKIIGD